MGTKKTAKANPGEATQVFRQFAWNLAGTLVKRSGRAAKSKPETAR